MRDQKREPAQAQREQELRHELAPVGVGRADRRHDRLAGQDHHVADLLEQVLGGQECPVGDAADHSSFSPSGPGIAMGSPMRSSLATSPSASRPGPGAGSSGSTCTPARRCRRSRRAPTCGCRDRRPAPRCAPRPACSEAARDASSRRVSSTRAGQLVAQRLEVADVEQPRAAGRADLPVQRPARIGGHEQRAPARARASRSGRAGCGGRLPRRRAGRTGTALFLGDTALRMAARARSNAASSP